jgi:hypothetical protein
LSFFILDCSISASWCLKDESNDEASKILDRLGKEEGLTLDDVDG